MPMKLIPIVTMAFLAVSPLTFANPTRVLGKWSDGYWYPARVQSVKGENVNLNYDDGDVGTVTPDRVRPIDWRVGTKLECNWKNQGCYYPGVIAQMTGERITVNYDDGDKEQITISRCRSM